MSSAEKKVKIAVRGLYKIFGENGEAMVDKVKAGMSKTDLLAEHGRVGASRHQRGYERRRDYRHHGPLGFG